MKGGISHIVILQRNRILVLLTLILMIMVFPVEVSASEVPAATVSIEVENKIAGNTPPRDEEFTFILVPDDDSFPAPENSTVKIGGSGKASFDKIVFHKIGEYHYSIYEKNDGVANYEYDSSVYHLAILVYLNDDNTLTANVKLQKDMENAKQSAIVFQNRYTKPDCPSTKPESTSVKTNTTLTAMPKTGDNTHIMFWFMLIAISGVGLLVFARERRKKGAVREREKIT